MLINGNKTVDRIKKMRAMISIKRVHMCKGVGVRFADFIAFFEMSHEKEIIWSQ